MSIELDKISLALENEFFAKKDAELIAKRREMEKMERTRKALAELSGVSNKELLDKLIALAITPQTLSAMAVVPLVEIAWADGKMSEKERHAIIEAAEKNGIKAGTTDHDLLESWLKHRPDKKLLDVWIHYIEEICTEMTLAERKELKKEVMGRAWKVAEAAGGILGLAMQVSQEEDAVLHKMDSAFK
jgi:hypothetical protein